MWTRPWSRAVSEHERCYAALSGALSRHRQHTSSRFLPPPPGGPPEPAVGGRRPRPAPRLGPPAPLPAGARPSARLQQQQRRPRQQEEGEAPREGSRPPREAASPSRHSVGAGRGEPGSGRARAPARPAAAVAAAPHSGERGSRAGTRSAPAERAMAAGAAAAGGGARWGERGAPSGADGTRLGGRAVPAPAAGMVLAAAVGACVLKPERSHNGDAVAASRVSERAGGLGRCGSVRRCGARRRPWALLGDGARWPRRRTPEPPGSGRRGRREVGAAGRDEAPFPQSWGGRGRQLSPARQRLQTLPRVSREGSPQCRANRRFGMGLYFGTLAVLCIPLWNAWAAGAQLAHLFRRDGDGMHGSPLEKKKKKAGGKYQTPVV